MTIPALTTDTPVNTEQLKRSGAAKDFEALLLSQRLHSVREADSGWLGTGEDQSSDAAFGLGEQELAKALSQSGGIGLSKLIDEGLRKQSGQSVLAPAGVQTAHGQAESAR
jgi:Rod binding domain-containing protein